MLLHFLMIHEDREKTSINHIGRKKLIVLMDGDNKGLNPAKWCLHITFHLLKKICCIFCFLLVKLSPCWFEKPSLIEVLKNK